MNKQSQLDLIADMRRDLDTAEDMIRAGLMVRVRDGFNGHPRSPTFEAGSGPRPPEDLADELRGDLDYSDPVGRAVAESNAHDRAAVDARRMVAALRDARRQIGLFVSTGARYQPRRANPVEQQTDTSEKGCESCARVDSPGTVGFAKTHRTKWWNEAVRTTTLKDGKRVGLCNFCYEANGIGARWTGELPPVEEVEHLRDNGRARKRSA